MEKIRVTNNTNHNVGVTFLNGTSRNIAPKGFVLASEDDIANWEATTALFRKKHLTFNKPELAEEIGIDPETLKSDSDDEIVAFLKKAKLPQLRKYLEETNEFHLQQRICKLAKESDLVNSKMNLIEEVFGVDLSLQ